MNKKIVKAFIRHKLFKDAGDLSLMDLVSLDEIVENYHFGEECGEPICQHLIGSTLLENNIDSDFDYMTLNKSIIVSPDFELGDFGYVGYNEQNSDKDYSSFSFVNHIMNLCDRKCIPHTSTLSKIFSHFYAMKYDSITDIYDREIFDLYKNFLLSPGLATSFWLKSKNKFRDCHFSLPDRDVNWANRFDGSPLHCIKKKTWESLSMFVDTKVDDIIGYDRYYAKKIYQSIIVATCVLQGVKVSDDQKLFLNKVKHGELEYEDYQKTRKDVWNDFEKVVNSVRHQHFLGHGYDIRASVDSNTFGNRGIMNILLKTTQLYRL